MVACAMIGIIVCGIGMADCSGLSSGGSGRDVRDDWSGLW